MEKIIGFVPDETINGLPLGFTLEGNKVEYDSDNCQSFDDCLLIIISDNNYIGCQINAPNEKCAAYLIQHNSNSHNWDNQTRHLKDWYWQPYQADTYSRKQGGYFDAIISKIENNTDITTEDLNQLQNHCDKKHNIRYLDSYAAWKILGNTDMTRQSRELLHGNQQDGTPMNKFPVRVEPDLKKDLELAREKMRYLLTR